MPVKLTLHTMYSIHRGRRSLCLRLEIGGVNPLNADIYVEMYRTVCERFGERQIRVAQSVILAHYRDFDLLSGTSHSCVHP